MMRDKTRTINVVHTIGYVVSNGEYYLKLFFWSALALTAAVILAYYGLSKVVGEEVLNDIVRYSATGATYAGGGFIIIGIPVFFLWLLLSMLSFQINSLRRMFAYANSKIAGYRQEAAQARAVTQQMVERNEQIRSQTLSIISDARNRAVQSRFITTSGRTVLAIDTQTGKQSWYISPNRAEQAAIEEVEKNPLAQLPANELFEMIYENTLAEQNCPSLIIAGKKRSGKSTFASWITREYADEIDFVVFDPKHMDPKIDWGYTTTVKGLNDNFDEIAVTIDGEMQWFSTLSVDARRKKRVYLFDEWLTMIGIKKGKASGAINPHGEKIFNFVCYVLTKLSYMGIGVIILPHATTATALGFPPGYAQLKSNFDGVFRFHGNLLLKKWYSYFEFDDEETEIPLWNPKVSRNGGGIPRAQRTAHKKNTPKGPFMPLSETCASAPDRPMDQDDWRVDKPVSVELPLFYEGPTARRDKIIYEAHRAEKSKRAIAELIGMASGGTANRIIDETVTRIDNQRRGLYVR